MNIKRFTRKTLAEPVLSQVLTRSVVRLDASIPALRTLFVITGIVGAAMHMGRAADYVFAAGLLLQLAIWFESWWSSAVTD